MTPKNAVKKSQISDSEKELMIRIRDSPNIALFKIKVMGSYGSCIVELIESDEKKGIFIEPLAILVNSDLLEKFNVVCLEGDKPTHLFEKQDNN